MKKALKTVSFAFSIAYLASSLPALCAPQTPFQFTEPYRLALKLRQEADDKLFDNMEAISEWLQLYHQRHGHFPEAGVDEDRSEQFFHRYLKNNPYSATGVQNQHELNRVCKVRFEYNAQINSQLIEQWKNAPPKTWKAESGTIVVMLNNENLIVIWGTGADQLPLVDQKTNKTRMVVVDINQPKDQPNEQSTKTGELQI